MPSVRRVALRASLLSCIALAGAQQQQPVQQQPLSSKPNIVMIMTDDQDLHMDSMSYMPYVQKHIADEGTTYTNHYCTIAVCCPSRVSLWTGKAAHNTNVTDLSPPYGGYPKFVEEGLNEAYLPVWLQAAGYETYYVGKLMNSHTIHNYDSPYPSSWTGSDFLLDPFTYSYLNSAFQRNQDPPISYAGQYQTDVVAVKSYGFLEDGIRSGKPFFLAIAPTAPHANFEMGADGMDISPPVPAERHQHLFASVKVPRKPHFNPDEPHGVSWISQLPKHSKANIESNDNLYRRRLQSLQAVDDMVPEITRRLAESGVLENTYIIFTTDNGYHIGQHRLQPGKECGFTEDVNIPFVIRGPGIARGAVVSDIVTSHTDLAPTILKLAGAATPAKADFDGAPMPVTAQEVATARSDDGRTETVNVEFWGWALTEGSFGKRNHLNNTYKAVRVIGEGYSFYYAVWCTNERELYDHVNDPHETTNLLASKSKSAFEATTLPHLNDVTLKNLHHRLDALLMVLKSCKGASCTQPWASLHPQGDVRNLRAAVHSKYDDFYEKEQQRVSFSRCAGGYLIDAEGPQDAVPYHGDGIWGRVRKGSGLRGGYADEEQDAGADDEGRAETEEGRSWLDEL